LEPFRLEAPPEALERSQKLLRGLGHRLGRGLVALEPGASYGPAKCWPAERFGALARRLLDRGLDVVTIGTAATRDVEARVAARAGAGLLRAAGRTPDLATLAGVLARADLLVANDTGPMHVAAALGTPVLALFGATDPEVSGPIGPGPRHVLREPTPCAPCFLRTCPVAGHPCLEALGVGRVEREALDLLEAARGGGRAVPAAEGEGPGVLAGGGAG
ncbi:MAG: glycosyltransferase family 9 protein, partial [Planctomycetota bacterium]